MNWLPPPGQRPLRVQEGSQEPGSQEAAESAAQGLGPGLGRKGGDQAAGPRFLPAAPPGGLHGSGPVPRAGPLAYPVDTVSPPPPPQPFPRRRNQEGGARPAGLPARLQLEALLLPLLLQEGWEPVRGGSSLESSQSLLWAKPQAGLPQCTSGRISPRTPSSLYRWLYSPEQKTEMERGEVILLVSGRTPISRPGLAIPKPGICPFSHIATL